MDKLEEEKKKGEMKVEKMGGKTVKNKHQPQYKQ